MQQNYNYVTHFLTVKLTLFLRPFVSRELQ